MPSATPGHALAAAARFPANRKSWDKFYWGNDPTREAKHEVPVSQVTWGVGVGVGGVFFSPLGINMQEIKAAKPVSPVPPAAHSTLARLV